jgi:hypothetical protein
MKIKILKNVLVEVEMTRLQEVWDKQLKRWDVITIEGITSNGKTANVLTYEGDLIRDLPISCFEEFKS